ncbi:MAG: NAD(P)-binding protein [Pseudomonadota bacterium]
MSSSSVFIIGAGVAGLACARVLNDAGLSFRLADKGRGPGGRCSSRRAPSGQYDHGASYFTVRDPRFGEQVQSWATQEVVRRWDGRFFRGESQVAGDPRFLGHPAMNSFIKAEADALGAHFGLEIAPPQPKKSGGGYDLLTKKDEPVGEAGLVVMAVPSPQAVMLLPQGSPLKDSAESAIMAPCWTLMVEFAPDAIAAPPFDALQPQDGPLDAVFWQAARPGREGGLRFVAHATVGWTEDHLENEKTEAAKELLAALQSILKTKAQPQAIDAHRWRYARVTQPAAGPFGLDAERGLATCGDWHIGPRVEDAWLSGYQLGIALRDAITGQSAGD